jgi:hypothetical protein
MQRLNLLDDNSPNYQKGQKYQNLSKSPNLVIKVNQNGFDENN